MRNEDEDEEDEKIFQQGRQPAPQRKSAAKPSAKQRSKKDPFVKLPLWWAEAAAKATKTPKALVWIALVHTAWKTKSLTFPLPNGRLKKLGVSRKVKRRALRDLEMVGLIIVDRRHGKSPRVTLVLI